MVITYFRTITYFVALLILPVLQCFAQTPEKIVIRTYTPQDYADIFSGRYRQTPVDIHGFLTVPSGTGKFPAVIIGPGSGGFQQWMQDLVARRLNEVGIATLVLDSFSGRGVTETATNQSSVPMAASVMDGFSALKALAQRPEIDARKIGVTGFSRGGTMAMLTSEKRLNDSVDLKGLQFAAHLPFYPACSTTFENPLPTNALIWFLMGEKDDYTPAAQCFPYIERLRIAGANVDSKVYPGAYHGWVSDARQVTYLPRIQVFSKCDARIDDTGLIRELASGATSADGWSALVAKVWKACGKYGAYYGVTEPARQDSLNDMVMFFGNSLKAGQ